MEKTTSKLLNLPSEVYISEDEIIAKLKERMAEEPYEDAEGTDKSWKKDMEIIGKCRLPMVPHIFSTVFPFCTEGETTEGFFLHNAVTSLMAEKLGLDDVKSKSAMLYLYNYLPDDPMESFIAEASLTNATSIEQITDIPLVLTGITAVKQVPFKTYQEFTEANQDDCLYKKTIRDCLQALLTDIKVEDLTINKEIARFCVDLWKVCVLSYGFSNAAPIFQEHGIDISKVIAFNRS